MTPKRILVVTLSLTLLGFAVILALGEIGDGSNPQAGARSESRGSEGGSAAAAAPKGPGSRLGKFGTVSDFELRSQFDEPVTLANYKGKVWIAHFMFTRCAGICPQMIENLRLLAPLLESHMGLEFASITCDPKFDTVEVLHEYSLQMGIAERGWKFLTGDKKVIEKLSVDCFKTPIEVATGEKKAEHAIRHSKRLVLIDRKGQVRGYYDGTSEEEVQQIFEAIDLLFAESPR